MKVQTEFTLYRNTQYPLDGTASGAVWSYPGTALTANTTQLLASMGLTLQYARWVLVWNPNTNESPTGVRLVSADSGPANEAEQASFSRANYANPRVDSVDVTNQLKAIIAAGMSKSIAHQTYGNGGNGCKIYGSWIECVWGQP